MDDLYRDHILDHAENPRRVGSLPQPTHSGTYGNRSCGDEITIDLEIIDGRIIAVRWRGEGCAISQAAASLLAEEIENLPIEEILSWEDDAVLDQLGLPEVSYARRPCALTFINTLRHILRVRPSRREGTPGSDPQEEG